MHVCLRERERKRIVAVVVVVVVTCTPLKGNIFLDEHRNVELPAQTMKLSRNGARTLV